MDRQGKGSSKEVVRFAESRLGRETSLVEGTPYRTHRGLEGLEDREDQEVLADPSLVAGRGDTCWDFESRARQERQEGSGHQVPVPDEIVPESWALAPARFLGDGIKTMMKYHSIRRKATERSTWGLFAQFRQKYVLTSEMVHHDRREDA